MSNIYKKIPFGALTLLGGWQEGHPSCKKVRCWFVGDDALHALQLQLSPPPPSPLAPAKSRM